MKKCPFCAEEIQDEAIKRKHCGEMLASHSQASTAPTPPQKSSHPPLKVIGGLALVAELAVLVYFMWFYDASVAVPEQTVMGQTVGGGRVHNVGLMQHRQNGIIVGSVLGVVGFDCLLAGLRGSNSTAGAATRFPKWVGRAVFYIIAAAIGVGTCALILHKIAEFNSMHGIAPTKPLSRYSTARA